MIGCYCIGDILHEDGLTGLRLSHNKGTLSLTDRREQVYDSCAQVGGLAVSAKIELLVWEERS